MSILIITDAISEIKIFLLIKFCVVNRPVFYHIYRTTQYILLNLSGNLSSIQDSDLFLPLTPIKDWVSTALYCS